MYLEFEHTFDMSAAELFAFHENPANLALLLRGWPMSRVVRHAGHIHLGAVTVVQERVGPFWVSMTFEHFLDEPPRRFGERLERGPFSKFEHIHEFVPAGSRAILRDRLEVSVPWYLGGWLTMKLLVAPKLRRFFAYRHAELERLIQEGAVAARR
jgi:ligand-binding SRPBCC domain-containing protein